MVIGLPVGAAGVKKSDGTTPTVRYVPVGENLLSNGGFETDTTGWSSINGATLTRDTGTVKIGSGSLKAVRGTGNDAASSGAVTVPPGVRYYFAGWLHAGTSAGAELYIEFYTSGGVLIISQFTMPQAVVTAAWCYVASVVEAPVNAATAKIWLRANTSGHAFFDAIELRPCVPIVESPFTEPASTGTTKSGTVDFTPTLKGHHDGDVHVYDMGAETDGTLARSSFTRVLDPRFTFTGDILLDNGIYRLRFSSTFTHSVTFWVFVYANGAWGALAPAWRVQTTAGAEKKYKRLSIVKLGPDEVVLRAIDGEDNEARFTLRRGSFVTEVETTRVSDSTGTSQTVGMYPETWRFAVTDGSTVRRDGDTMASSVNVTGSGLTEPYALGLDVARPVLAVLGFAGKPTTLLCNTDESVTWEKTSAGTSAVKRTFFLIAIPWPWLIGGGATGATVGKNPFFVEAEEMISSGGTAADAGASGGSVARLDAINEQVYYRFVAGRDLPLGEYSAIYRMKDSAQVASDARTYVNNVTDASMLATTDRTLTGAFAFYALDFALAAAQDGDTVEIAIQKITGTANNLDVDYVLVVPRKRNSSTPSHVFFPRDVARNALMVPSVRSAVRAEA